MILVTCLVSFRVRVISRNLLKPRREPKPAAYRYTGNRNRNRMQEMRGGGMQEMRGLTTRCSLGFRRSACSTSEQIEAIGQEAC